MAFHVSPELPQYLPSCSLPSIPQLSAHSFNSCHVSSGAENGKSLCSYVFAVWVSLHIYSNTYFYYKLMLLYPQMLHRAHNLKIDCNRDAICVETFCHSPPCRQPSRFWGAPKRVAAWRLNKKKLQNNWTQTQSNEHDTNRSPRKRSSTSLKHSAARTYLKTVSFLFLPPSDLHLKGWEKQKEEKAREIFGIKETEGKEKRGDFDLRLSSCR